MLAAQVPARPAAATSSVEVTLLTPSGLLLALGVVVPLLASGVVRRRGSVLRRELGLPHPAPFTRRLPTGLLLIAAALLGLAAAQPRVEWMSERTVRTNAEVLVVLDTSRSMIARADLRAPTRFERARRAALRFRGAFDDVPVGLASLTDRVLPHLFPSVDDDVFVATLQRSLGVDRPPPQGSFLTTATRLAALETVVTRRYFSPTARTRLVFVLTDGETVPVSGAKLAAAFRRPPRVETIFLHVWGGDERVYSGGRPEPQYRPDPRSRGILAVAARALGGHVFRESDVAGATAKARELLGGGPTRVEGERRNRLALAPYLTGAVFLPLGLLLWRRDR